MAGNTIPASGLSGSLFSAHNCFPAHAGLHYKAMSKKRQICDRKQAGGICLAGGACMLVLSLFLICCCRSLVAVICHFGCHACCSPPIDASCVSLRHSCPTPMIVGDTRLVQSLFPLGSQGPPRRTLHRIQVRHGSWQAGTWRWRYHWPLLWSRLPRVSAVQVPASLCAELLLWRHIR